MAQKPAADGEASALRAQHALVSGGSRGIGWAIARALARAGANVSLIGRDTAILARRAETLATEFQTGALDCPADVTQPETLPPAVARAEARFGPVQILVNNAGFGASQPFAKMTADHWRDMLAVNLDGVFHLTRAVVPGMLAGKQGRIINIASTAGVTGYAYVAAYCAAKHGVVGLTRALAREYARSGLTVNAVCPGFVETDMTENSISEIVAKTGRSPEAARAELEKTNPQGRLVQPDEVASAVLWLASPAAQAVTGQAIVVAGGEVMP